MKIVVRLIDALFSVVAHVDYYTGAVRQRMSYDAWGRVKVILPADFDGSGLTTDLDAEGFAVAYSGSSPAADFDGDGAVTAADEMWLSATWAHRFQDCVGRKHMSHKALLGRNLVRT